MAAKLGSVGEYVYLWDKFLYLVVLDSWCEPDGKGRFALQTIRSICIVSFSASMPIQCAGL